MFGWIFTIIILVALGFGAYYFVKKYDGSHGITIQETIATQKNTLQETLKKVI
jgi:hypothetical protein